MATQTKTLNLTPLFVVWSVIFVVVAFAQDDFGWLWWAAAPWLFVLGFGIIMFLFAATFLFIKYRQGEPITVTTRKGVRRVRRGQAPVWIERRR